MDHTPGEELAANQSKDVASSVRDGWRDEPAPDGLPRQLSLELDCAQASEPEVLRWQVVTRYRLRLVTEARVPYDRVIRCGQPESAARFLHQVAEGLDREVFGALFLNGRHQVVGHMIAYVGTLSLAPAEPRGILVPALLANAASVILFHNHPSGDPEPSPDDQELTRRMVAAGDLVGVKVLDHIILGEPPQFLSLFRRRPW